MGPQHLGTEADLVMQGQIIQQGSSYRQGLVLGLTMAEIMLLLVFCLLIAMATFLRSEQAKRVAAEQQVQEFKTENQRDHDLLSELRENDAFIERLRKLSGRSDPEAIDQYWRELVDSRAAVAELEKSGLSLKEIRNRITDIKTLLANGDGGLIAAVPVGHQWPPIISLSEAGGYFFKSGSAELSSAFRDTLIKKIPSEILEYIKKYDVDVIEVVGHTDEQPDRPTTI